MREFLKSICRRVSVGWFWAAAVLLILPNCSFNPSSLPPNNLDPGATPHSSAVLCDIALERRCATPADLAMGTRLASAAEALVAGQGGTTIGLDDSPAALAACGGVAQAVVFKDAFPRGTPVCVNCGDIIPAVYADTAAICQAACYDLFGTQGADGSIFPNNPPTADTIAFCTDNARPSTNFPLNSCFEGACSMAGTLNDDFADPRAIPEPVDWIGLTGVSAAGGTLTRTAPGTGQYDAGASSSQLIAGRDAYVEFTATGTDGARLLALSNGPPPAGPLTLNDIGFGTLVEFGGNLFVFESGAVVSSFGSYASGDKFRIKLRDNFDGTATVTYVRITGPCVDGAPCNETVFHTSTNRATYPVRVDALFREQGATITDARIVRIR